MNWGYGTRSKGVPLGMSPGVPEIAQRIEAMPIILIIATILLPVLYGFF